MEGINVKLMPSSPKRYILLKYKKATLLLADVILVNNTILLEINKNFILHNCTYEWLDFSSTPSFQGGDSNIPPFFSPIHSLPAGRQVTHTQVKHLPGGTVGYPAHPRLIRCPSVCNSTFKFSAENRPGPTDLVKYCLKIVNCREL